MGNYTCKSFTVPVSYKVSATTHSNYSPHVQFVYNIKKVSNNSLNIYMYNVQSAVIGSSIKQAEQVLL